MKTLALAIGPIRKPNFMPALAQIIADSKTMRQISTSRIAKNTALAAGLTSIECRVMESVEIAVVGDRLRNAVTAPNLVRAIESDKVLIGEKFIYWERI
jgi:hypothetical protein